MSVFPGFFPSLPGVACDNFAGNNVSADQFFLSHCHTGKNHNDRGDSYTRINIPQITCSASTP